MPSAEKIKQLRRLILRRHRSVHAFCKEHEEIKRSTLYQLLSGKYGGNVRRQVEKIRAQIEGRPEETEEQRNVLNLDEACAVLQAAKCEHCRRLDKRFCRECRTQTKRQAEALIGYLEYGSGRKHGPNQNI